MPLPVLCVRRTGIIMHKTSCHDATLKKTAARFAALGSAQRLGVLRALVRAGPAGLSVGALGNLCGLSGSTLTHHIKTLATAGLLAQMRQGRSIVCTAVDYDDLRGLSEFLMTDCSATPPTHFDGVKTA